MNKRHHLRSLLGLLRQATSALSTTSSLNTNGTIVQPSFSSLLSCLYEHGGLPLHSHAPHHHHQRHAQSFYSTTTTTVAALPPPSTRPQLPGIDDFALDDYMTTPEFRRCSDYMIKTIKTMKIEEIHRLLCLAAFSGITDTGISYVRPTPLALSVESNIQPTIEYLCSIPGIKIERALRNAPLLLTSLTPRLRSLSDQATWLRNELDMTEHELGKVVSGNGNVLTRKRDPLRDCFAVLYRLQLTKDQVRSMVIKSPRILVRSPLRMTDIIELFRDFGLRDEQIRSALYKLPSTLCLSRGKIENNLQWLQQRHGLSPLTIAKIVSWFPGILSYSPETMQQRIEFLQHEIGLGDGAVKKILNSAPDTLSRSESKYLSNIEAMRGAGMQDTQILSFLNAYPGALRFDISSPRHAARLKFLREELRMDVGTALATNPMYVSYSLERIASRAAFLKSCQRSLVAMTSWLSLDDAGFAEKMARRPLHEWLSFREEWLQSDDAKKLLAPPSSPPIVGGVVSTR